MDIKDIKHFEEELEAINKNRAKNYRNISFDAPAGVKDMFLYRRW
jgi:hypothetical protein